MNHLFVGSLNFKNVKELTVRFVHISALLTVHMQPRIRVELIDARPKTQNQGSGGLFVHGLDRGSKTRCRGSKTRGTAGVWRLVDVQERALATRRDVYEFVQGQTQ